MAYRLELISQPAGTGKTHYCLQIFRRALAQNKATLHPSSYFILPNREHTDRIIELLLRRDGTRISRGLINPPVLTIHDFLKRWVPIKVQKTPGELLRKIFLRAILREGDLSYFSGVRFSRGFLDLLSDFLLEAKAGFLDAAEFEKKASVFLKTGPDESGRPVGPARPGEAANRRLVERRMAAWSAGAGRSARRGLDESVRPCSPVFGKKLSDLVHLFRAYDEKLASAGFQDPDDLVRQFVHSVEPKGRSSGTGGPNRSSRLDLVILDGFYHFTGAQIEFIRALSRFTTNVLVTLTLDRDPARSHVFEYPERTRCSLLVMGFREIGWKRRTNRRVVQPPLAFLEKMLFQPATKTWPEPQDAIQIFEATGASGEIEMVAREIQKLIREKSYHYSDCCLLLRSIGSYEEVIRSVFRSFEIPVQIHERRKLKQNPFIHALAKWIRLLKGDWTREDLVSLLESSYYGFSGEAASRLKEAALEEGITEGLENWTRFSGKRTGEEREILGGLLESAREFGAVRSPQAFKSALTDFIRRHRMIHRLFDEDDATREDFQAYRALEKICDQIILKHTLAGIRTGSLAVYLDELAEAIEIALFSETVRDKNRVQVYDIAFALQKEYKVIFVLGLLERIFPERVTEDPILKDEERKVLNRGLDESGLPVGLARSGEAASRGPDESGQECFEERLRRVSGERYFFYMAVTRAREKLYLTYPRYDLEGYESLASFYVEEVKKCFAHVPIRKKQMGELIPHGEEVSSREDLFKILTHGLFGERPAGLARPGEAASRRLIERRMAAGSAGAGRSARRGRDESGLPVGLGGEEDLLGVYAALWNEFVKDEDYLRILSQISRDEERARIRDPRVLEWFQSQRGPFSATRLELFATCPFKFFSARVLHLQEEQESIRILDLGSILHKVLEQLYRETVRPDWIKASAARPDKKAWLLISDKEAVKQLALEKLDHVLGEFPFHGVKKFRRDLERARLREALVRFIDADSHTEAQRRTVPLFFEKTFGQLGQAAIRGSTRQARADRMGRFSQAADRRSVRSARADGSGQLGQAATQEPLGYLRIPDGEGGEIPFHGRIDRVDVDPETQVAVVIDYKSGPWKANKVMENLEKGVELQIPLYLLAVKELMGMETAAGELYPVRKPLDRGGIYNRELMDKLGKYPARSGGALEAEDFSGLLDGIKDLVPQYVARLRKGDVSVRSKGCDHCPYDQVCRFEKWKLIYSEKEKVWERRKR